MNLRPVPVLAVSMLTLLGVFALGVSGPLVITPTGVDAVVRAPVVPSAGGVVCPTGADTAEPDANLLLLAAPEDGTDVAVRGIVLPLGVDGDRQFVGPTPAGGFERRDILLEDTGWLWVGWADRALAAWQERRTIGAPGQPRGVIASACLPADASVQTVLGLRTDEGFEALLRLANPFNVDATFAVTFVTTDGTFEPIALRNVSVSAGRRLTVRLNDHVPEEVDVAAIVTVGAGRLAIEGLQRSVAAVNGIEGIAAVAPVTEPSVIWTFPWLPVGPDVEGSVWVLNPHDRPVVVALTLHTPQGASLPDEESVEVGPGAVLRLDTADLVSDGSRSVGLTLRSETAGILAGASGMFFAEGGERTGLINVAGARSPDPEWAVAGAVLAERDTALHVVNLDEVEAVPRVTLTTLHREGVPAPEGDDASDDDQASAQTSREVTRTTVIEDRPLAPGATIRIPLPLSDAVAFSAVVDGGRGLVVSRTTFGRDLLEPVAVAATPSFAWRIVGNPLDGQARSGWVATLAPTGSGLLPAG